MIRTITAILRRELSAAIVTTEDLRLSVSHRVHEARKACKKVRAVLQLLGPANEIVLEFETRELRDAARCLSELREAEVNVACHRRLLVQSGVGRTHDAFAGTRAFLAKRRRSMLGPTSAAGELVADVVIHLQATLERVDLWEVFLLDTDEVVVEFEGSLARSRKAMLLAQRSQEAEDFHTWRKRTKYHLFQARMLTSLGQTYHPSWYSLTAELTELLGWANDLVDYRKCIEVSGRDSLPNWERRTLLTLTDQHLAESRSRALAIGARLFPASVGRLRSRVSQTFDEVVLAC